MVLESKCSKLLWRKVFETGKHIFHMPLYVIQPEEIYSLYKVT